MSTMKHMYGIDESGIQWIEKARLIAVGVAKQNAQEVDKLGRFPTEAIRELGKQGFFGLTLDASVGGQSQPPRVLGAVVEELAQVCASTAMIYVMHTAASQAYAASTTFTGKTALLQKIAKGEHLTTLAFSEKGSRSQFWAPVSQFVLADSGKSLSITAQKSWVTSASNAHSFVSSAQRPGAKSPLESTLYMVRREAAGVKANGAFNGLGLCGNDSLPVTFEGVKVSHDELLTEHGQGSTMMLEVVLPWFIVGTAAMSHGLALASIKATSQHLADGSFENTGTKLRDLPNLRMRLGEMNTRTEASRALLGYAAAQMENPDASTPLFVLQARASALATAIDVTDLAMKACGGAAFSRHLGVERYFRDARAGWVMAPTVDHLYDFIGKALTGLPLF
jgi:alkylation response protein AidB-like acyl-CoA dehydrogenase